jgi:hypothetical protein
VNRVSVLDPLDIAGRVEELKRLRDGWLDGRGLAPSAAGLDWLAAALDDVPVPYLHPTAEWGVRAEWSVKPWELSLVIDLGAKAGRWHALNLDDDDERSEVVDLADPAGWVWVAAEVRRAAA